MSTADLTPPRRASPSARYAALVYLALVVYGSLYPWYGWRDVGISLWSYLTAPPQRYVLGFDLLVNVLAYVPLGFFMVLGAYPRVRGVWAVLLATVLGVLVSAQMEALQTLLPQRVASYLDVLCNSSGALIGAGIANYRASALLDRGALRAYRLRWFYRDASSGLILLALWLIALLHPKPFLFGLGDVLSPALEALRWLFDSPSWAYDFYALPPTMYLWIEALITMSQILSCGVLLLSLLRVDAPRRGLFCVGLLLMVVSKILAQAWLGGANHAFAWLTPGVQYGLLSGALMVLALSLLPSHMLTRRHYQRLGWYSLIIALLLVNVIPENAYLAIAQQDWYPGRLVNINAVILWLGTLWPFIALIYFGYDSRRK